MTDEPAQRRLLELRRRVFLAAHEQPDLSQTEQVEVVDQVGRSQNHQPAGKENRLQDQCADGVPTLAGHFRIACAALRSAQ